MEKERNIIKFKPRALGPLLSEVFYRGLSDRYEETIREYSRMTYGYDPDHLRFEGVEKNKAGEIVIIVSEDPESKYSQREKEIAKFPWLFFSPYRN